MQQNPFKFDWQNIVALIGVVMIWVRLEHRLTAIEVNETNLSQQIIELKQTVNETLVKNSSHSVRFGAVRGSDSGN